MTKFLLLIVCCTGLAACATHHPAVTQTGVRHYVVQDGDNFYSIAFAFEMSVERLRAANPWLHPSNLAPGMRLTIPRGDTAELSSQSASRDRFIWPVNRLDVSSGFGYRYSGLHAGIDLRAPRGTPIHASAAGKVVFSGSKNGYGRMIILDHGKGLESVYAHNDNNKVRKGQRVRQGEVIASVGRSGNATGYHVHFEIRRYGKAVDPSTLVNLTP